MSVDNGLYIDIVRIGTIGCLCMFRRDACRYDSIIAHYLNMIMCMTIYICDYVVKHSDAKKSGDNGKQRSQEIVSIKHILLYLLCLNMNMFDNINYDDNCLSLF